MKQTLLIALIISALMSCNKKQPQSANPPVIVRDTIPADHFCKAITALPQQQAVGVYSKYWKNGQVLRIKFIGGTAAQKKFVTDAFDQWAGVVNLNFMYVTTGASEIRVKFDPGGGSWSYIGTDCKSISNSQPTMNIGWAGLDVTLHEIGHALGMAHEQQSPKSTICWNQTQVIKDLSGPPNNWDLQTIRTNVFTGMTDAEAEATAFDPASIMEYSIPGKWTCDGLGIVGGKELSALDRSFMGSKYPKPNTPPVVTSGVVQLKAYQRDSIVKWMASAK